MYRVDGLYTVDSVYRIDRGDIAYRVAKIDRVDGVERIHRIGLEGEGTHHYVFMGASVKGIHPFNL